MERLVSPAFWQSLAYKFLSIFFRSLYASPGLLVNYFPYVFQYQVFKGTAEDSLLTLTFAKSTTGTPLSKAISIYAFDNPMYVELSYDGTNFDNPIEIPAGRFFHFSSAARRARVQNKTIGLDARFQLIVWYLISIY